MQSDNQSLILILLSIEQCTLNYCQDGIRVYFGTDTKNYNYAPIYGHYELQPGDVNGRPYFKMGSFGLYWDGISKWWIGQDSKKGLPSGYAYYIKDSFCPHQLSIKPFYWSIFDGFLWKMANFDLGISCKHISIK